jgi:hypothetical protein
MGNFTPIFRRSKNGRYSYGAKLRRTDSELEDKIATKQDKRLTPVKVGRL